MKKILIAAIICSSLFGESSEADIKEMSNMAHGAGIAFAMDGSITDSTIGKRCADHLVSVPMSALKTPDLVSFGITACKAEWKKQRIKRIESTKGGK